MKLTLILVRAVMLSMCGSAAGGGVEVDEAGEARETVLLKVGLEWFLNADHMPLVVAQELGYFAEVGLSVELMEPEDHFEAGDSLAKGEIDIAVTETLHLAQESGEGKTIGFAKFLHTDGGVMYFDETIKRPRDMCGKTIQYPGSPGPGGPAIVQTMVEADGGECDIESYGKMNNGFEHVEALARKWADLATLIFANFEIPAAKALGHEPRFFSLKEWGVPDFCVLVFVTGPRQLEERRTELRKFIVAIRKAIGFIHRDPDAAADIFRARSPDSPEATVRATLPMFPNDNSISFEYFDHLVNWLVTTGQLANETAQANPPHRYWTNDVALP